MNCVIRDCDGYVDYECELCSECRDLVTCVDKETLFELLKAHKWDDVDASSVVDYLGSHPINPALMVPIHPPAAKRVFVAGDRTYALMPDNSWKRGPNV